AAERGAVVYDAARMGIITVLGLALLAAVAAAATIIRGALKPLAAMTEGMKRLAAHDLATQIVGVGRKDEIGAMAAAVQVFKDNMIEADRLTAAQAADHQARDKRTATLEALTQSFEQKVSQLVGTLSAAAVEMEATAKSMTSTADDTNIQSAAVAAAAEQA